ncbi:MAG: glycosyltransferase family 2 protein [Pseudomonadota bacterium]
MLSVLNFALVALSIALFLVTLFLAAEVIASFGERPSQSVSLTTRGRIGVVIPAHNEREGVAATVAAVRVELRDIDRVIVVADNCDDDTAEIARPAGAVAIERKDKARCGKGYALQFGVDHLRHDPPETVVFIDADCRPAPGAIARIAERAAYLQRPVQALYLMKPPEGAGAKAAVSAFAWLLLNRVRMSGLQRLSGVTRLTGAGMAFPWRIISESDLASGEIVEDLALTLKMVEAGAPPVLDLGAVVTSELARSDQGAATQRARWEHGSLRMAARMVPALLLRGARGDLKSFAMAFDLLVPPLTVLAALIVFMLIVSSLAALGGSPAALAWTLGSAVVFAGAIALAWAAYGRAVLPPSMLAAIGPYLLGKARVYGAEGRRSAKRWTRTDRGGQ